MTQDEIEEFRAGLKPGTLVINRMITTSWCLLVLSIGRWVECLDPDGNRSLHPLREL